MAASHTGEVSASDQCCDWSIRSLDSQLPPNQRVSGLAAPGLRVLMRPDHHPNRGHGVGPPENMAVHYYLLDSIKPHFGTLFGWRFWLGWLLCHGVFRLDNGGGGAGAGWCFRWSNRIEGP